MTYDNRAGNGGAKVTLTKATPSINLTKPGDQQGIMRVNLNWSRRRRGLFRRGAPIDLDLGCLYELSDGRKGVIQATGGKFGDLERAPHIRLDADDRSGSAADGENLHIDLGRPDRFQRILIFAFIYEGVPHWAAADAVATLYPTVGPRIEVRLDSPVPGARLCAIALLRNNGRGLVVNREVEYIEGTQRHLDQAYNWGMQWHSASK